jgi:hypothetical protein
MIISFATNLSKTFKNFIVHNLISYSISELPSKFLHSTKIIAARQDLRPIAAILKSHSLSRFIMQFNSIIYSTNLSILKIKIKKDLPFMCNSLLFTAVNSNIVPPDSSHSI